MSSELPQEAIAFAGRMYDAARAGQVDIFQQALPRGLPPNLTNEKGDTLVSARLSPIILPTTHPLNFSRTHLTLPLSSC
jgi:hypothetical protein